jgi:predicted TIM-barrel fold metal-dependent hydrolase
MVDCFDDHPASESSRLIEQGFKGISIPGHRLIVDNQRVYLDSPKMIAMFKLMEQHDLFLSVTLADGDMQVAELENVIAACPRLRIAIGHFGMPVCQGWQEQVKLARHPNVMIESGGITWLYNSEFYPFPSAIRAIREAAGLVGMEKLMWGSDYPRTITAITYRMSYDFILKSQELSHEEKELFLGANAARFYGLKDLIDLPYIKNMSE